MIYNPAAGYSLTSILLAPILVISYYLYFKLRKNLHRFKLVGSIVISSALLFLVIELINNVIGLFFGILLPLTEVVGLLILIGINEVLISKVESRFKDFSQVVSLIIVLIMIFLALVTFFGGFFTPYNQLDENGCIKNIGGPCAIPEDKGKVTAAKTEEAKSLMRKYGREKVTYRALKIHLAHDPDFVKRLNPNFKEDIGCIIVVRGGNEGYVMQEEKSLRVIYVETLQQFKNETSRSNSQTIEQFYNSLH